MRKTEQPGSVECTGPGSNGPGSVQGVLGRAGSGPSGTWHAHDVRVGSCDPISFQGDPGSACSDISGTWHVPEWRGGSRMQGWRPPCALPLERPRHAQHAGVAPLRLRQVYVWG